MNKTLMLVICDFLLLSMLALARFDSPEQAPQATLDATAVSTTAEAELISLLEESLQSELESRFDLNVDLAQTRQQLSQQARDLAEREAALATTQENLTRKAAEAAQLAATKTTIEAEQRQLSAEKARIEAERQALAYKFETTRTKLADATNERMELTQTLGQLKAESSVSKERLSQAQQDLIAREVILAQREAQLKAAQAKAQQLNQEREMLDQQLKVATAERALLQQNLFEEQQANQQLQAEKAQVLAYADRLTENVSELGAGVSQLGQGLSELTQSSEAIQKEMDANRPRTMSEIFTRFQNNRATIRFTATEKPRIGSPHTQIYESNSIVIADGTGTYLVTHSADTPFARFKNPERILAVQLEVTLAGHTVPLDQIAFMNIDPRLIYIAVPQRNVDAAGLETFTLARQPERWEEAVLIKNDGSNFGRAGFRRLTTSDRFLKMERPALGELFADFASSRGDLAFSQNSHFIGVLSDTTHAVVIDAFLAGAILDLGPGFNSQATARTLKRLQDRIRKLPEAVQ